MSEYFHLYSVKSRLESKNKKFNPLFNNLLENITNVTSLVIVYNTSNTIKLGRFGTHPLVQEITLGLYSEIMPGRLIDHVSVRYFTWVGHIEGK